MEDPLSAAETSPSVGEAPLLTFRRGRSLPEGKALQERPDETRIDREETIRRLEALRRDFSRRLVEAQGKGTRW
jgi:hypothetical protein